jgi:predicted transcriptional regulator
MTTLAEAEIMLSTINAAISEYASGKRRKIVRLGTHEFSRSYEFVAPTWTELLNERTRLEQLIVSLTPTVITPTFRQNTTFPLIVSSKPI